MRLDIGAAMIERARDAAFLNRVLNDPKVRPFIAGFGDGDLDVTERLADPRFLPLVGEHGTFVCFRIFQGLWEVHTAVLPSGRGEWTRRFGEAGKRYMFTATDCAEILTRVPEGHAAAERLTHDMGFVHRFLTPRETEFCGEMVSCAVSSITIQDWAGDESVHYEKKGAAFHDWLNRQLPGEPHPLDPDHNAVVGVCLDMVAAGQIDKAICWYARWSMPARHPPIVLVGRDPPQIRFDAGVLTMQNGELRLDPCH